MPKIIKGDADSSITFFYARREKVKKRDKTIQFLRLMPYLCADFSMILANTTRLI